MALNVQYGCGLQAPAGWVNFDASPTLRLQRVPILGAFIHKVKFPRSVRYGDITKKLPGIPFNSCDAIYCSHVLEHLPLEDFRIALKNTYNLLKPGGRFRCVLPDLQFSINKYLLLKETQPADASIIFMKDVLLGMEKRPKGFKNKLIAQFGNSHHLWMWDQVSMKNELFKAGFTTVRECRFNDSADLSFKLVEDESRFNEAIAFEATR